ncbi:hypothetical protein [Bacillus cereus]|nr:hypothetical protein [Bacillus cereus]QDD82174.1 not available [Bacillus cereus]
MDKNICTAFQPFYCLNSMIKTKTAQQLSELDTTSLPFKIPET